MMVMSRQMDIDVVYCQDNCSLVISPVDWYEIISFNCPNIKSIENNRINDYNSTSNHFHAELMCFDKI